MSLMLEQAIIDATALREAALKNAEQALIEKYAPEIKEAVNKMLDNPLNENAADKNRLVKHEGKYARVTTENEEGKVGIQYVGEEKTNLVMESELEEADEALLQEEEGAMAMGGGMGGETAAPSAIDNIPLATGDTPEGDVNLSMNYYEFDPNDFNVDLEDAFLSDEEKEAAEQEMGGEEELGGEAPEGEDMELGGDLGGEEMGGMPSLEGGDLDAAAEGGESLLEEELINEIAKLLDEELTVDMGETKQGHITTDKGTLKYEQEKELALQEDDEEKEENEEYEKKIKELDEVLAKTKRQNKQFLSIINELNDTLSDTLLSNAKLLYSNKTLSDASLNERQKSKIVEAIAKANTPEEAKSLQEALKTTVGSTKKQGPKSLSESVQRRSNLSSVLPRRKKPENQQFSFAQHMKKLAGIE